MASPQGVTEGGVMGVTLSLWGGGNEQRQKTPKDGPCWGNKANPSAGVSAQVLTHSTHTDTPPGSPVTGQFGEKNSASLLD